MAKQKVTLDKALQDREEQYHVWELARYEEILSDLEDVTRGARTSMHEPDEQDIEAKVVGDHLDNAMGNGISLSSIVNGGQEFVVIITQEGREKRFNLADLIALAKVADPYMCTERGARNKRKAPPLTQDAKALYKKIMAED